MEKLSQLMSEAVEIDARIKRSDFFVVLRERNEI